MTTTDTMERVYTKLLELVGNTISAVAEDTYDDKLGGMQNTAKQALRVIEQQLRQSIEELRHNAEWNTFTLAFYGETNAGKSTLIECLRILLKQGGKVKEHRKFNNLLLQMAEADNSRREALLIDMQACKDGNIIGDGHSDYTRKATTYKFTVDGKAFALIDVPGTEGDEAKVNEQISNAVKRAHAVFYVTGKAAPPQTGEAGRPGTLEKIKAHLGDQTEIWTVFNKRIMNPRALPKGELANAGELASLADLDAIMGKQLGKYYQGTLILSALPAFLAAANCLAPGSKETESREKFLASMPADTLLKKSGLERFCHLLTRDLLGNFEAKIRHSNLNKLSVAIDQVSREVDRQRREHFLPLALDLQHEAEHAGLQLDNAVKVLKNRLTEVGEKAIRAFETEVRKKAYKKIEGNIGNDDFKSSLREIMKAQQELLQKELPVAMQMRVGQFQSDVLQVVERFQQHANDLQDSYEGLHKSRMIGEFTLEFKIDKGINLYGLLASIAGGILMFWNPGGWVLMSLGAITLLTGLFKSVWGFFSSSYRMGQQRKSTDDNLENVCKQIRKSLRKSLESAMPSLEQKVEAIRDMLWAPVLQTQQISNKLDSAHLQLNRMASTLRKQSGAQ
ncbi:GTPase [Pseudomonas abietaniphila]|uniref:GTPase n=1 Tax=Pseudomonas abietaniphila TaxID=89065 RepID=UPI0009E417B9|nr:GTPase [Pseudomonas abietaniphila]